MFGIITMLLTTLGATGMGSMLKIVGGLFAGISDAKDAKAKRELIYVDDLANACIFFMKKKTKHSLINIGTGKDFTIKY